LGLTSETERAARSLSCCAPRLSNSLPTLLRVGAGLTGRGFSDTGRGGHRPGHRTPAADALLRAAGFTPSRGVNPRHRTPAADALLLAPSPSGEGWGEGCPAPKASLSWIAPCASFLAMVNNGRDPSAWLFQQESPRCAGEPHHLVHRQVEVFADPGPDGYSTSKVYAGGQSVPVVIGGLPLGEIAVNDILPSPLAVPTAGGNGA